jgi:hypothetical protein
VLVDIDHLVDYVANHQADHPAWTILPFHAWEWVMALTLRRTPRADGLATGLAAHLALDQMNKAITHPFFYLITFRALNGFRAREPLVNPERYARGAGWMKQTPREWL